MSTDLCNDSPAEALLLQGQRWWPWRLRTISQSFNEGDCYALFSLDAALPDVVATLVSVFFFRLADGFPRSPSRMRCDSPQTPVRFSEPH
jgi:hypothetical protein